MMNFSQGDIIKISNLKDAMLVVSKNEFIKKTGVFHVCPLLENYAVSKTPQELLYVSN